MPISRLKCFQKHILVCNTRKFVSRQAAMFSYGRTQLTASHHFCSFLLMFEFLLVFFTFSRLNLYQNLAWPTEQINSFQWSFQLLSYLYCSWTMFHEKYLLDWIFCCCLINNCCVFIIRAFPVWNGQEKTLKVDCGQRKVCLCVLLSLNVCGG